MVVFGLSQPFPSICQSCERETLKAKGWEEEEDEELEERRRREEIHGKSFERAVNKGCAAEPVPGEGWSRARLRAWCGAGSQRVRGRAGPCRAGPMPLSSASELGYF